MNRDEVSGATTVTGRVLLPAGVHVPYRAILRVIVEDVSRADAPSEVVGAFEQSGGEIVDKNVIPFTIKIPSSRVLDQRRYSVSAHLDMSGSRDVKKGDLLSTQSYPVLTRRHGHHADIRLQQI